jgi:hypothetical protein
MHFLEPHFVAVFEGVDGKDILWMALRNLTDPLLLEHILLS